MKNVTVYTDGACKGNPGPGGYGAVLIYGGKEKEISGGERETTNNRMELTAAVRALSLLKEPCEVSLFSDSKYLVDAINKGWLSGWVKRSWKKSSGDKVLNVDLWEEILRLINIHKVTFSWVEGHAGHEYNERCDELATTQAAYYAEQR